MLEFLPVLHSAVGLDERGIERLERALATGQVPVWRYQTLAGGRATDHLAGGVLKDLLLQIADQSNGFDVALEILFMRLHSDHSAQRAYEPELLEAGRLLLPRVTFHKGNQHRDYELEGVVKACLTRPDDGPIAAEVAARIRQAVAAYEMYSFNNDLLKALLEVQPAAVLDALFADDELDRQLGILAFEHIEHSASPADAISCEALIAWCEADREHRYPLAASIVSFALRPEASGPQVWPEQAKALLPVRPTPEVCWQCSSNGSAR